MRLVFSLLAVTVLASSAFAAKLPATQFTCTSNKSGLVVVTTPQNFSLQVFDLHGNFLYENDNVYPTYSYSDVLNPMIIDVKMIDNVSGKTVLLVSAQGQKIQGDFNGDDSFVCKAR